MTFKEKFDEVRIKLMSLKTRLVAETGSNFLTEKWVATLTEEEKEILQLGQWFKKMSDEAETK